MRTLATRCERPFGLASVVFSGAVFGFFFAWVCSTMWGLDNADPRVAIEAMQAINDAVQNGLFFSAFFLTPILLLAWVGALAVLGRRRAVILAAAATVVYVLGVVVVTGALNVPLNDDLAEAVVSADRADAERVWDDYSGPWQTRNAIRAVAGGVVLALAALAFSAGRRRVPDEG